MNVRATIIGLLCGIAVVVVMTALARSEGWSSDPAVRQWYETRQLTPEAQKRIGFKSCCAAGDVVRTRFRISGGGNDVWEWLHGDKWERVPEDIIHWGATTPTGEPVLFAIGGRPVCFFAPSGGI